MKRTAVVILNWNGRKLMEEFLPSVVEHTSLDDVDIVVADNCSMDDSISFLENNYPQIQRVLFDQNYGFAEGYNRVLSQLDSEYVVLLNSDVEVTTNWIQPMIAYLDTHPDVAALQPKLLAQKKKQYFEYAGAAGGYIDKYGYPFCRGRIFGVIEKDEGQYDSEKDVFWASGACLMMRQREFVAVGGLDATFFAHMEEIDLCWRLNARGRRVVCLPSSVVYHVGGATLKEESPRKTYLNFRNNLLMLYKNMSSEEFDKIKNVRLFLDYLAVFKFFVTGKRANAKAILQAQKEFKSLKPNYELVRRDNLQKTTHKISTIYSHNLLWVFYIKGKKIFSMIRF